MEQKIQEQMEGALYEQEEENNKISDAMGVLKKAMVKDIPSELGSYAHSWHCNIAMMCHDAILTDIEKNGSLDITQNGAYRIGNDAASRFMKLCFGVETNNE